jgi:hypothetical protein
MVEPQPANIQCAEPEPVLGHGSYSAADGDTVVYLEDAASGKNGHDAPASRQLLQQLLRPIMQGIEALARAQFEQSDVSTRAAKAMLSQESLSRMLVDTKQAIEQRNVVNRLMFEALHAELRTYKDAFVKESVLKPVIRDLISLYDDITEIHRQLVLALSTQEKRGDLSGAALMMFEHVLAPTSQLEHNGHAILEVLERIDVTLMPSNTGKLDKQTQRAVSLEITEDPDQDQQVVKVVKRGFIWAGRILRPEDVIIKKWKEGYLAASGSSPKQ